MDYEPDKDPGKRGRADRATEVPDDITGPAPDPCQAIVDELEDIVEDWTEQASPFTLNSWEKEGTKQQLDGLVYHSDEAEASVQDHQALKAMDNTAHPPGAILSMAHNHAANRVISYEAEFPYLEKPPFMLGKFLDEENILLLDAPTTAPGDRPDGLIVNRDEINGWVGGDTLINLDHIQGIDEEYHGLSDTTILNFGTIDRNADRAINVTDDDIEQHDDLRELYDALDGSIQEVRAYFSDIEQPRHYVEDLVDRTYGGEGDGL
jgi:hypothetical protein